MNRLETGANVEWRPLLGFTHVYPDTKGEWQRGIVRRVDFQKALLIVEAMPARLASTYLTSWWLDMSMIEVKVLDKEEVT